MRTIPVPKQYFTPPDNWPCKNCANLIPSVLVEIAPDFYENIPWCKSTDSGLPVYLWTNCEFKVEKKD